MKSLYYVIVIFCAVALSGLLAAGCGKNDQGIPLVTVGDRAITTKAVDERIAKLPAYYQSSIMRNRKKFLDDLVIEELFYEEAIRAGLQNDPETKDVIREARRKILIARLIKRDVEDKVKVDPASVQAYYDEHKEEFRSPELRRSSHILVSTEPEALEIREAVNAGKASFEEVARARSRDDTAKRGGDIGYYSAGQLVPEFEEACKAMKVGDPCGIVRTQFGYHVIKVTEVKPERYEELDKVKGMIEDRLKREQRKVLFNILVSSLKGKYGVKIDEAAFAATESAREGAKKNASGADPDAGSGRKE